LQEDQSEGTIEKAYTTAETYKRILNKRVIPRFGRKSPLAIEPLEVEKWLREVKKAQSLENPTLDKIRRVSICGLLPLRLASSKKTSEFASGFTTSGIRWLLRW
jgi:hypothetical protein